jgi:DNA-binding transcriptional LysR family regulator
LDNEMNERLEIDALRALLAIAVHGGVTRAAEHLALSQSAVSHKIRRLEQALDCPLLNRRAGAPLFTDAGDRLLGYSRRIIDLHDEALSALGRKQLAGTIRLGMTEDTTTSGIARILGRFTRLYPEISVRTRTNQSLNVQSWLKAGEIDVAVMQVFARDVGPDDVVLFEDSLHWVRAPDLAVDPNRPVPFLSFDSHCFYKQWAFGEGQSGGHDFKIVLECPSAAGIRSAVRSGLGVALLNGMHVDNSLAIIDGIFPPPPPIAFIARLGTKNRTPAVNALVQEIAAEMQGDQRLRAVG